MDVYNMNSKFVRVSENKILVHMFLPDRLLSKYEICSSDKYVYSVAVLQYGSKQVTKFRRVWGKFLHNDGTERLPPCGWGLCISGYAVIDAGPRFFDVMYLKITNLADKCLTLLKFSMMNILPVYLDQTKDVPESAVRPPVFEQLKNTVMSCRTAKTPTTFILSLLTPDDTFQHKYHPALETPGIVRGIRETRGATHNEKSQRLDKSLANRSKLIPVSKNGTWHKRVHVISGHSYYIWLPDQLELEPNLQNVLLQCLTTDSTTLYDDPLELLSMESDFLYRIQNEFARCLEHECRINDYSISQKIPTYISMEASNHLEVIFLEALVNLKSSKKQHPAWLMATYFGSMVKGLWMDILTASPTGESLKTNGYYLGEYKHELTYYDILKVLEYKNIIYNDMTLLLVSWKLSAWLILPGGFVIKGTYNLSLDDIIFVQHHYGK